MHIYNQQRITIQDYKRLPPGIFLILQIKRKKIEILNRKASEGYEQVIQRKT